MISSLKSSSMTSTLSLSSILLERYILRSVSVAPISIWRGFPSFLMTSWPTCGRLVKNIVTDGIFCRAASDRKRSFLYSLSHSSRASMTMKVRSRSAQLMRIACSRSCCCSCLCWLSILLKSSEIGFGMSGLDSVICLSRLARTSSAVCFRPS